MKVKHMNLKNWSKIIVFSGQWKSKTIVFFNNNFAKVNLSPLNFAIYSKKTAQIAPIAIL